MKDKIIELLKQYEDAHTQGVYRCDYDELAGEVVKLFLIRSVCTCTKFRETPMINGKHICSICNKPIMQTDL